MGKACMLMHSVQTIGLGHTLSRAIAMSGAYAVGYAAAPPFAATMAAPQGRIACSGTLRISYYVVSVLSVACFFLPPCFTIT
eukprot:1431044-Amphidinium_carterae.1